MTPPILFIHGAFAHGGAFDAWVEYFAQAGFDCHAPSLPGRNPTDPDTLRRLTLRDNLERLLEVRGRLSEPPIVIGHSMGGLLGQKLAARSSCAALVLLGSAPPGVLWAHPRAVRHLLALMPKIIMARPLRPPDETLRAVVFNALGEREAQDLSATIVPDSGRTFRSLVLGTQRMRRSPIGCPVLVLSGARDINGAPGIAARLARRYDAAHHVVPDSDHWLIAPSRVSTVCPVVHDWLGKHTLSGDRRSDDRRNRASMG